jgi:outer membrane receptor protein involved in Fe transport
MVSVRPSARTVSTFTLRREGKPGEPRIAAAGVGGTEIVAAPASDKPRDESETAWRLRHLKRSILRDSATMVALDGDDDGESFAPDSLELLGRALGSSARAAGSFFSTALQGQVNLLTTGAFDNPTELLQLERTRGVAFFALGAPVGSHGDWVVKAAVNQGDLSSWVLAGNYLTRNPARHRYQFGMSYGLHRYEGGNPAALAAMTETARNVGTVYAHDEWTLSKRITIGYGANYAHYDYLLEPAHFSPRLSATVSPTDTLRVRAVASRAVTAPGAEEFLPPARTQVLPPQRTFAPYTRDGFRPEDVQHYELAVERLLEGATIGVRAFHQRIDEQQVTMFGVRAADTGTAEIGHYFVASAGDLAVRGWGVTVSHALAGNIRGSFDYSMSDATWANLTTTDRARLARRLPSAIRDEAERVHDFTTSLETAFPDSATRVLFLYKMNSAYIRADGSESRPGLDGRWDVQVNQGLPFMNFLSAEWEMLVAVRNLFRESFTEVSVYDELLVARPPKRLIGGLTVRF